MVADQDIDALIAHGWDWHSAYRHLQTAAHASAMSAQRAETEGLSPQDASAVGASRDAHPSSEQSS